MGIVIEQSIKEKLQSTYLWRYMSLPKFLDLITTQEMYFANNMQLIGEDPYEGALPMFTEMIFSLRKQNNFYKQVHPNLPDMINGVDYDKKIEQICSTIDKIREYTYINCWHINNDENYLMWKSYAKEKGGVAIVTDIESLLEAFDTDIEIKVIPVEYETNAITKVKLPSYLDILVDKFDVKKLEDIVFTSSLYKKEFFKNEQELRLIFQKVANNRIKVNLNKLIKCVYISPNSTDCEKSVIINSLKKINAKIDIENIIHNSNLSRERYSTYSGFLNALISAKHLIDYSDMTETQKEEWKWKLIILSIFQDIPPHKFKQTIKQAECQTNKLIL